ncbi:hypothetical protein [Nostoc sp.]|uniref:hypothetical protein n=1 Tax=Nostoc sp. TaxID=1180 RepID=UPI002FF8F542
MVEKPKLSTNSELLANIYKPLIYILPRESYNLNQLVSPEISTLEKRVSKGYVDVVIDSALATSETIAGLGLNSISSQLLIWGLKRLKEAQSSTSRL